MVLRDLDLEKKEEFLKFFRDNFKINLENYEESKVVSIINLVNSEINYRLEKELEKYKILSYELEKQKNILWELNNSSDY